MAAKYVKIKLTADWMGNGPGQIIVLNEVSAALLIGRGTAIKVEDDAPLVKDISSPPKDKMVKRPTRKK